MDQYWLAANSKGEGTPLLTPPDISDDDLLHSVRTSAMDSRKGSGVATLEPYVANSAPLGDTKVPKFYITRNYRYSNSRHEEHENKSQRQRIPQTPYKMPFP